MTLLVVSPDYASHLLPLATLATAWRDAGHDVVVATGPATAPIVEQFGFRRVGLELGRGSNAGVMRTADQEREEADSLAGFFAATRIGMVETLRYQADERLTDLMWRPVERASSTIELVEQVRPDAIIVDHLAFSARLGLQTAGIAYGDIVLGHPTALPVGEEVYGLPPAWPSAFEPDPRALEALRVRCIEVSSRFTAQWNDTARRLDAGAAPIDDAFASHGDLVLYNSAAELVAGDGRTLPPHRFLGSTRRDEPADAEVDAWLAASDEPFVYVSFGSFLSVRADVLARVAEALRRTGLRAAIATGAADAAELGSIPPSWLVRGFLPQVRLLGAAAVAVSHGGNNSVGEAIGQAVPLLVLPFSTDQFAGAASVERAGLGLALDPNAAGPDELAAAIAALVSPEHPSRSRLAGIAAHQRAHPGPSIAFDAVGRGD